MNVNVFVSDLEYVLLSDLRNFAFVNAFSFICIINDHFYSSVLCYVDISSLLFGVKLSTTLSDFYKFYPRLQVPNINCNITIYCQCKSGKRTLGCCAHISIICFFNL